MCLPGPVGGDFYSEDAVREFTRSAQASRLKAANDAAAASLVLLFLAVAYWVLA